MDYGDNELGRYRYGGRSSIIMSPDFEGLSLEIERKLTWPTIGRAVRSMVRKIR
jgi:hypothetical protein